MTRRWVRWARTVSFAGAAPILSALLVACPVRAEAAPEGTPAVAPDPSPAPRPACPVCPACRACCRADVEAGPHAGVTVNDDQWLVGAHLRSGLPCVGGVGFGPVLTMGLGGNYVTFRSSGRLDYLLWLDSGHRFAIYPAIGASAYFYVPVGGFGKFCRRVQLEECWGNEVGLELGGGFRHRWIGLDAMFGFGGLPALTVVLRGNFPLITPEEQ